MELYKKFAQILELLPKKSQTEVYLLACEKRQALFSLFMCDSENEETFQFDYFFWDQLRAAYEELTEK